ncbi:MAG: amidohydrolase, partial [Gemmatimonadota bacterium]|nr:amidohydrolase [Gemmatimonadota bacterium]
MRDTLSPRNFVLLARSVAFVLALVLCATLRAQPPSPSSGQRYGRLLVRNAMVIDGTGNPARGPMDILIEGSTIARVSPARPADEFGTGRRDSARTPPVDRVIDATGMYVMPGIVDMHGHIHFSRNRQAMPKDYVYKLWLGHGITTIREPGSGEGTDTTVAHARLSSENRISAPTIIPYVTVGGETPAAAREAVRRAKAKGGAGLKVFINRPDVWEAISEEARALGLPIATDLKIQELDAVGAARLGVRSLEHWYGVPDAAIPGPQNFPENYSYDDELDRFRWAGDLWRQADSARLSAVLDTMLAHNVTWDPTFAVYEANRDLARARTLPWFQEYALPNVLAFFEPDP